MAQLSLCSKLSYFIYTLEGCKLELKNDQYERLFGDITNVGKQLVDQILQYNFDTIDMDRLGDKDEDFTIDMALEMGIEAIIYKLSRKTVEKLASTSSSNKSLFKKTQEEARQALKRTKPKKQNAFNPGTKFVVFDYEITKRRFRIFISNGISDHNFFIPPPYMSKGDFMVEVDQALNIIDFSIWESKNYTNTTYMERINKLQEYGMSFEIKELSEIKGNNIVLLRLLNEYMRSAIEFIHFPNTYGITCYGTTKEMGQNNKKTIIKFLLGIDNVIYFAISGLVKKSTAPVLVERPENLSISKTIKDYINQPGVCTSFWQIPRLVYVALDEKRNKIKMVKEENIMDITLCPLLDKDEIINYTKPKPKKIVKPRVVNKKTKIVRKSKAGTKSTIVL